MPILNSINISDDPIDEISKLKEEIKNLQNQFLCMTVKLNKTNSDIASIEPYTLTENPTFSSIRLNIPGTRIYDTIVLKDNDTTLDGFDYATYQGYGPLFDLTTMRTLKFVYTHTGIVTDRFFITRYIQEINSGNIDDSGIITDTLIDLGTYIFERTYLRDLNSNYIPQLQFFQITAFYPLITDG